MSYFFHSLSHMPKVTLSPKTHILNIGYWSHLYWRTESLSIIINPPGPHRGPTTRPADQNKSYSFTKLFIQLFCQSNICQSPLQNYTKLIHEILGFLYLPSCLVLSSDSTWFLQPFVTNFPASGCTNPDNFVFTRCVRLWCALYFFYICLRERKCFISFYSANFYI